MRNLFGLRDSICTSAPLPENRDGAAVVGVDLNHSSGELLVLNEHGLLRTFDVESGSSLGRSWNLSSSAESGEDLTWFSLTVLRASGSIVCASHAGLLISISVDLSTGKWGDEVMVEGDVECGIMIAAWSPDQSRFVVLTNQHTMLCMNSEWDVLDEVPFIEAPAVDTTVNMSWRGDGEQFALQSIDATGVSTLRVYSNELELVSTGRNIADGPASVLKGVGNSVAFSTNGVLVAFPQQRIKGKHQIAFIEKNGLRHGDFDVSIPESVEGYDTWSIENLQWDLTSNLLAVEIRASRGEGSLSLNPSAPSVVQVYYRDNYHWYLKRQWAGLGLRLLRFDSEARGRLYLSQPPSSSTPLSASCVRIVELAWEVVRNTTRDSSVVVADGNVLHLTPLGYNTVPPPMSMFKVSLAGPYVHSCLWTPTTTNPTFAYTSGLAVLSEVLSLHGPLFKVELFFLGEKGDLLESGSRSVDISGLQYNSAQVRPRALLAVPAPPATQDNGLDALFLVMLCNRVDNSEEVILTVGVDVATSSVKIIGSLGASTSSKSRKLLSTLGMPGGYALLSNADGNGEVLIYEGVSSDVPISTQGLPEECYDAAAVAVVLPRGEDASDTDKVAITVHLCIGLSVRSRLYCGDMLVEAGASSFAVNEALGVLLYITTGTTPHLHFVSLLALAALDPDRDVDVDESVYQMIEYAPPRPVERGARLVVCVPGDPRVVVQQPRGNLEAFEPRALVLSLARNLINAESAQYLQCLLMLRRQRVDLNFMIDHDPRRFVHFAPAFMKACIGSDAKEKLTDILCLFISSLEDGHASLGKYPQPLIQQVLQQTPSQQPEVSSSPCAVTIEGLTAYLESSNGDGKVNALCHLLRSHLEVLLEEGHLGALKPILCTFAKQKPPLLEEALLTIRRVVDKSGATLSSSKAQGLIRYLAFLADGELIFNAALGICDFDMSRAMARQCQMDPKVYLPLLTSFEAIGRLGSSVHSYEHWVMHVEVSLHLKRPKSVIVAGLKAISAFSAAQNQPESESAPDIAPTVMTPHVVSKHILNSTKEANLFAMVLEQLLEAKRARDQVDKILDSLLSDTRYAYAVHLRAQSEPDRPQVIALLLITEPPRAAEAVEMALSGDDWQQAFFLAGKYGDGAGVPRPEELANRIINTYENELVVSRDLIESGFPEEVMSTASVSSSEGVTSRNKAVEVAHMCLDYRSGDLEGAVSILLKSQELLYAAHLASRKGRLDLLTDDVSRASRRAAYDYMANLQKYEGRLLTLVDELKRQWEDPAKRLAEVREKDEKLSRELDWLEGGGDADGYDPDAALDGDVDDNKSEFSMTSMRSDLSFVSGASSILSELSNGSQDSRASKVSRSSSAAVSVLSELKLEKRGDHGGSGAGTGIDSSFSVKGLEHSLLSRGSGKDDPNASARGKTKNQLKREKYYQIDGQPLTSKQLRRKNRGEGISNKNRDTLGLGKELIACTELWKCVQIAILGKRCAELCQVLLLLGSSQDMMLAARVQFSMDNYADVVRNNPPPLAPSYPRKWLDKKQMSILRRFQDVDVDAGDGSGRVLPSALPTLWKVAADGISLWYSSLRLISLNHVVISTDFGEEEDLQELADAGDY